jgi:hypothetical protein
MQLLKLMAVENIQAGDSLILGTSRFVVASIEDETYGRNFYLKASDGMGKCQFIANGEKVAVEL